MKANTALGSLLALPLMDIRESLLVLTIWLTFLAPVVMAAGLVAAHITMVAFMLISAPEVARRAGRNASAAFILFFVALGAAMATGLLFGAQARFPSEALKPAMIFLGTFCVGLTMPAQRLRAMLAPAPWLCVLLVLGVFIVVGPPVHGDGRLTITNFLSPNVLGYALVMNGVVVLAKKRLKILDYLLLGVLGVLMLACLSRGALLAAVAVLSVHMGLGRSAAIFGGIGATLGLIFYDNPVIQRMLVVEDAVTTGGSGRTDLWGSLLQQWVQTPMAWLSGFGPASVHRQPTVTTSQDAAHSMYVGGLYYWGLLGLGFLLCALAAGVIGVRSAPPSPERTLARDILVVTIVNGLVDESYNASQMTSISSIFFAVVVAVILQAQRTSVPRTCHDYASPTI